MKKELISIIVPVYNVEKYLNRCIDSIINQTYKNLEIILVDDGSTDNSGMICDKRAKMDNRIKVIHKKNGGLSDARNYGIEIATGKYITFIDSDDYVDFDYVEYLYGLIIKYKCDISISPLNIIYGNINVKKTQILKDEIWNNLKLLEDIFYGRNFSVSVGGKLFLKECFDEIRFPVGKIFEDNATTYKLIEKNKKIAVGFSTKYNYIIREGSITTTKEFNNSQLYLIEVVDEMANHLKKYDSLKKAIYRMQFWSRISTLNRMILSTNVKKEEKKKQRKDVLKYRKVLFDIKAPIRDKLSIIILLLGLRIYEKCWKKYKLRRKCM